jgi:DNA repair protein RecO (recombination protein O)
LYFKDKGIILGKRKISDSDVVMNILTVEHGKIQVFAKESSRGKSRANVVNQPFIYGNFDIKKGSKNYRLISVDIEKSYYSLRENLYSLSYGSYFLELVDRNLKEEMISKKIFLLLLKTLDGIEGNVENYIVIKNYFEMKFLYFYGVRPNIDVCLNCGEIGEKHYFSPEAGGIICNRCNVLYRDLIELEDEELLYMRDVLYNSLENILNLNISDNIVSKVDIILNRFILSHLACKKYKSLEFIKSLI